MPSGVLLPAPAPFIRRRPPAALIPPQHGVVPVSKGDMLGSSIQHLHGVAPPRPLFPLTTKDQTPFVTGPRPPDVLPEAPYAPCWLPAVPALLIAQRQSSVILLQHRDLYAKPPALGNAGKFFYSRREPSGILLWCPWSDCLLHRLLRSFAVSLHTLGAPWSALTLPWFSLVSENPHVERPDCSTTCSPFFPLLDRNGYSRRFYSGIHAILP